MLARVARRCLPVRPVRAVRLVSAVRGVRATLARGLATAAPAKGGAAKAAAADVKAPAAAAAGKGKGKGDAAPAAAAAAEDTAAAPAAAVKRVASSEGDMMSDAQRSKALAARKAALPAVEERLRVAPQLYSAQTALSKLPKADAGKYIKIDAAALPDTIRHAIQEELDMTGDYVMVRNDLYQLISALRSGQLKQHSVLIDGGRGVGKSMALALCVLHAKQRGALVLATRGEEFLRDTYGQIAANKQRDGVFDQPRLTLRYVRALRDGQAEALRKIKLKNAYDFNAPAQAAADAAAEGKAPAPVLPAPVTLYDLVAHAATGRLAAAKYWYDIIAEIRLATEVPVLIAADGVNWWHHRSELLHPDKAVPIRGAKLALADGFLELFKSPPRNGTCVFSTTSAARDRYVKELYQMATMQFVVTGYTDAEMHAALQHYSVSKLIVSTLDADYKNRVKALSGNVPTDVFEHVLIT